MMMIVMMFMITTNIDGSFRLTNNPTLFIMPH